MRKAQEKKTKKSTVDSSLKKKLRKLAYEAYKKAYSPYSTAKVGSALITNKKKFYTGCNVENGSYGATVCAERNAIGSMINGGDSKISKIYVYTKDGWPPCGICRQVIKEFASKDLEIILGNSKGKEKILTMDELYPHSFGPDDMVDLL